MSDWSDFRQEVLGDPYMVWHDGPDFHELARRYAEDPAPVLALVRSGVLENDDVAAQACRELVPTEEQRATIVAMLEEVRTDTHGSTRTEVAASLHALGAGAPEELSAEIVRVLHSPEHWGVRLDAARRLEAFAPTEALVAALAEAVQDGDYLVRFHSANTLHHWAGHDDDIDQADELFGLISDDAHPEGWTRAAEALAAAVKR